MLNSLYNSLNSAILVDLLVEICYNYKKSYMVYPVNWYNTIIERIGENKMNFVEEYRDLVYVLPTVLKDNTMWICSS